MDNKDFEHLYYGLYDSKRGCYYHTDRQDQSGLAFIKYCVEHYDEWQPGMAALSSSTKPMHKSVSWETHYLSKSFFYRICTYTRWCREKGFETGPVTLWGAMVDDLESYCGYVHGQIADAIRKDQPKRVSKLESHLQKLKSQSSITRLTLAGNKV